MGNEIDDFPTDITEEEGEMERKPGDTVLVMESEEIAEEVE